MNTVKRNLLMVLVALLVIPQATPQGGTRAKFVVVMRGDGTLEGISGLVAFTAWEGPSGLRLTELHATCANPEEAHKDFENRIIKFKVVLREPKKDKDGRVVGERAEVVLDGKGEPAQFTTLFSYGLDFVEIMSTSKDENRELEKFLSN